MRKNTRYNDGEYELPGGHVDEGEDLMNAMIREAEEELKIIEKRASLTNEKSLSSYLRKQAIKGFIINVNFSEFDHLRKNITAIGTNINQIAKRVNSTNRFYDEDIEYIKKVQKEIWQSLNSVQSKLRSL